MGNLFKSVLKLWNTVTDPGSPVAGDLWYNSTDGRMKYRNGSTTLSVANLSDITSGGGGSSGQTALYNCNQASGQTSYSSTSYSNLPGMSITPTAVGTWLFTWEFIAANYGNSGMYYLKPLWNASITSQGGYVTVKNSNQTPNSTTHAYSKFDQCSLNSDIATTLGSSNGLSEVKIQIWASLPSGAIGTTAQLQVKVDNGMTWNTYPGGSVQAVKLS